MARSPTLLDRFRRMLIPPGRPSDALGVPASGEDAEAELAPLFERLDGVDDEAAAIEAAGREDARRIRDDAERQAQDVLVRARAQAEDERARAAASRRAEAAERAERARADARREVERLRTKREQAVSELVAEVVECVRRSSR
jgi:hypothetical protein